MNSYRREDLLGGPWPGLCAQCLPLPKERGNKNDGESPFLPYPCPLCCNWPFPNTHLKSMEPPWHNNKSSSFRSSERHVILWRSCSAYPIADSCNSCHQYPSGYATTDQWDEFINFTTNFKDYQRAFVSFPGIGRFLLVALLMVTLPLTFAMSPPPNYSHANMPNTNFTCNDKATGGYYADPEAGCQMFHVCVRISDDQINDFRFLCPNDTVFDQQNFICTNWWDIDCERSTRYYSKNDLFRVPEEQPTEYEYETPDPVYYEYVYEYVDSEGTTEGTVEDDSLPGRHRLNLRKEENEKPKGRSVETPFLSTTENPRLLETTTKGLPWRTSSSTTLTTTSAPTTRIVSISSSRSTTNQRRSFTPTGLKETTSSPPLSITGPTSYFHFVSNLEGNSTTENPSNAFEIQRFNSRGGSPYQDNPDEDSYISERNDTRKPDLDSNDPFANYEWKKDFSGVTASARTRYETLFGETNRRGRESLSKDDDDDNTKQSTKSPTDKRTSSAPSQNAGRKSTRNQKNKGQQSENQQQKPQQEQEQQEQEQQQQQKQQNEKDNQEPSSTKAKHKEFSNFRFYKTAFGRSYSSDDFLGKNGDSTPQIRISDPVRLQRTASRNTRYSIYG